MARGQACSARRSITNTIRLESSGTPSRPLRFAICFLPSSASRRADDGWLSDIKGFTLARSTRLLRSTARSAAALTQGNVGSDTGMICHEFKAGLARHRASSSRMERYTVGALVQANYGARDLLRVDGVPVGREIGRDVVPAHRSGKSAVPPQTTEGSIIVVLATTRSHSAPMPAACPPGHNRALLGWRHRCKRKWRYLYRVFDGQHIGQNDKISNVNMLAPDAMTSSSSSAEATEERSSAQCAWPRPCPAETVAPSTLPLDLLQR